MHRPYRAPLVVLALLTGSVGANAFAQEAPPTQTAVDAVDEAIDVGRAAMQEAADRRDAARGPENYEEMAKLEELEEQTLQPTLIGDRDSWDPELLAPYRGQLEALHADLGYVTELHQLAGAAPAGSKLIEIEAVRARFESTQVLGLTRHNNPAVRAYLDFFDGRGKPILAKWIARMNKYAPMITETLEKEGLPSDLIYVAMIESGFSPWARSSAGAVGIWQFIRGTGRDMGLRIDAYVDERRDPVKATRAAARYLQYLHDKFGSWPLALAGYNGGPGLVAKTINKYNSNNYWFISRHKGMYDQTRRYVPKVVAAGIVCKNADIFDLDILEAEDQWAFDIVEVPARTRLSVIADAAGTDVDTLEDLNPELLRAVVPPGDEKYPLRIPEGSTSKFVENFDEIEVAGKGEYLHYRVRFGESVRMIGEKLEVAPRVIRATNGLAQGERPPFGDELVIPKEAMGEWTPRKKSSGKKVVLLPSKKFDHPDLKRYFYDVNDGDTLESIGRGLQVKPADIVLWNDLDPDAHLDEDMYIQIFLPADRDVDSVALAAEDQVNPIVVGSNEYKSWMRKKSRGSNRGRRWHRVRPGESLWLIARKYKVTVEKLRRWNRSIRGSNALQPGQKILVYPGR
ncbi:MAG: transglycosylase SLT domain-containing protein [Myxococcota bacterium]